MWDDWMEMQYLIPVLIRFKSCFLSRFLPPEVRLLKRLEVLDVSGNYLSHLPASLGELKDSLLELNADRNQLKSDAFDTIVKLRRLRTLGLACNPLDNLPVGLHTALSHLTTLRVGVVDAPGGGPT